MRLPLLACVTLAVALAATLAESDEAFIGKRRTYWAFQKPVRTAVPMITSPWIRTPIDAFLLAAMQAQKLTPSAALSKERLLRRVTLDLTGLPPTLADTEVFLKDTSPEAYEKVVDRLIASPQYGERWGMRWLD